MNLLAWFLDLWISGLFKILLRSVLSILCMGRLQSFLREAASHQAPRTSHPFVESTFSPNAETSHMPTRSKFQHVHFAYFKQSDRRNVSEVLDNAGLPVPDTVIASHFALPALIC